MKLLMTLSAWMLLFSILCVIIWGTLGDGSLKWMLAEAKKCRQRKLGDSETDNE